MLSSSSSLIKFSEPETECIHFVDANDITDNEDFFEDETEVSESDSPHDLNPDLGDQEPLNLNTSVHLTPNLLKDIPLDKVYLDDSNVISKEANLTLNTLNLNSEDPDLVVSPTELTLDNFDGSNLESEVVQLNLLPELNPDLIDPESIDLRAITKSGSIEDNNMISEERGVKGYNSTTRRDKKIDGLRQFLQVMEQIKKI
ncbi:hypothetical protein IEQ34_002345 [Dendrobium chrysotoxum]|uniref:Uncharacterized protein n=1 Tax=Dendrobium chrysotoxum TaxID=161865 RepID=A0AAV7HNM2_DENCH|nr:hypothetical protein IEQ34_002345 [Dendrobium chrysotoxum]